jgi:hypothetical protein
MVARPIRADKVEVEYVDGARKWVERRRLPELSSRWRVVDDGTQDEGTPAPHPEPPALSALKGNWYQYALDRGATREHLEGMTRAQLIAEYGPQNDTPQPPQPPQIADAVQADEADETDDDAADQAEDDTSDEDKKG